ncbi:MAG TPA: gephyrin-like molybdotransferase Glp [Dissulfurispiraceae bacterium]|nr:gephyrin-like molybdotransferase Glp [Dissulfurispiraceae bacterium]
MLEKNYLMPGAALTMLLDHLRNRTLAVETVPLHDAFGRILAVDIIAQEDLPGFARSIVDGYAVRAVDTFGAREQMPAYLTLAPEILMGTTPSFVLGKGEAAPIPTGGMLPEGADAVVMIEDSQVVSNTIVEIMHAAAPAENVIQRDEDIRIGECVLEKGQRLRPQDVGALAGLGIPSVEVFRRPIVAIVSTGDEIVPLGEPLTMGKVRDINSFTLRGLIQQQGSVALWKGIIRDDFESIRAVVAEALAESDMVLIVGGTSAGVRDMSAAVINAFDGPGVLFHGVAVKPGKPLIGGIIGSRPILGLPGHPAAAAICFANFIRPALDMLSGEHEKRTFPRTVPARMAKAVASVAGREDHIRVRLDEGQSGLIAVPVLGKSGLITTLVRAHGTVAIAGPKLGLDAGEQVDVRLFEP